MTTCSDCPKPARARGYCSRCYQAHRRAGSLETREPTHRLTLLVPLSTLAALQADARTGETVYATALRWLAERSR